MAGVTEPVLTAFTTSVARALAAARIARRDGHALKVVAPTTRVRTAIAAVEDLVDSAELAATATAELGREHRAVQRQLYPTTGREVQAAPQDPPQVAGHVTGERPA